jgi:hypothetical protein
VSSNTRSNTLETSVVSISTSPEVYITDTNLFIKDAAYPRAAIRGCRVAEVGSFEEGDLFYANETGPGKVATNGMKWLLGLVGLIKFEQPSTEPSGTGYEAAAQAAPVRDVDPPLYCLALATDDDEIQVLPSINRLLLLDLAARLNRELGL